jgi:hypothetical protein
MAIAFFSLGRIPNASLRGGDPGLVQGDEATQDRVKDLDCFASCLREAEAASLRRRQVGSQ